ncbi:hypothetical protein [Liquorilactobacillus sicerae]|nr:hypothetical protein [Liquorilactobacillus sicerae]
MSQVSVPAIDQRSEGADINYHNCDFSKDKSKILVAGGDVNIFK